MIRLTVRRLAWSVPLLFVVSVVTFLLIALLPGSAARTILGANAPQAQVDQLQRQLGLDRPLWAQYGHWLRGVAHGDLGTSLISQQSVTSALEVRLAPTLALIVAAMLVSGAVGVALGIAARRGGVVGRAVDVLSLAGLALPGFWLGLLLVVVFAVNLHLFPPTGYVAFTDSPAQWLRSLVLPVVILALPAAASVAKQTREAMSEALRSNYIRTLRAAGVSERSITYRHALKNAANPVLTVVGLNFIGALSGTVVVESIFSIPGLGGLAVQATLSHDLPLIQGAVVCFTVIVIAANLLTDLAYGFVDPRIRLVGAR